MSGQRARPCRRRGPHPAHGVGEPKTDQSDDKADQRPGQRHPKFGLGVGALALHLGHAAQGEQHDGGHADAAALRHHRVSQLMQHNGDEEEQRRQDRCAPDHARTPIMVYEAKLLGEGENDEDGDEDPTVVQADADAEDPSELHLGLHAATKMTKLPDWV